MTYAEYKTKAPTIKDLLIGIKELIHRLGEDAEWTACHDRRIYIMAKGGGDIYIIEPSNKLRCLDDNAKTGHETTKDNNSLS